MKVVNCRLDCKQFVPWYPYVPMLRLGSSVGLATELRAGRSGIQSRWGRDFPPFQTGPGAHPASCKMGTGSFTRVKCGRGLLLPAHHLLLPRSSKSRAIPLPTLWATPDCNGITLPLLLHLPVLHMLYVNICDKILQFKLNAWLKFKENTWLGLMASWNSDCQLY